MNNMQLVRYLTSLLVIHFLSNEAEAIVGGHYAKEGQFGYHVSLEISNESVCGGAIVNERFVITAANCIIDSKNKLKSSSIRIIAGINDLKSTSVRKISIGVQEVFIPTEYNSGDDELPIGDIAVLKLKDDLNSNQVSTYQLQLPNDEDKYENIEATITGFGWNVIKYIYWPEINVIEETDGHGDGRLRYAKTTVTSNDYAQKWEKNQLDSKHLCGYLEQNDPETATGTCTGDVGGPLMYNNTLIGILSKRRDGCREDEQPAIYTRVSSYANFISEIANEKDISGVLHITLE